MVTSQYTKNQGTKNKSQRQQRRHIELLRARSVIKSTLSLHQKQAGSHTLTNTHILNKYIMITNSRKIPMQKNKNIFDATFHSIF